MSDLKDVNGTIRVITTTTDEPFSYIKDGKNVGYDIDVITRFCREYGYGLELGDVDFNARIPALASGKYDFTTSMNVTPEREEEVMFSDPVSEGGIVAAVRAEELESASVSAEPLYTDYIGKRIGIKTGSSFEAIALENFPDSEFSYYDTDTDLITALQNNKIDAFLNDEPSAQMEHYQHPDITFLSKKIMDDSYHFLFPKGYEKSDKLLDEFNHVLAEEKAKGTLDELKKKWMDSDENIKTYDDSDLTGENGRIRIAVLPDSPPFSWVMLWNLQPYSQENAAI